MKCPGCGKWLGDSEADTWDVVVLVRDAEGSTDPSLFSLSQSTVAEAESLRDHFEASGATAVVIPVGESKARGIIVVPAQGKPWFVPAEPGSSISALKDSIGKALATAELVELSPKSITDAKSGEEPWRRFFNRWWTTPAEGAVRAYHAIAATVLVLVMLGLIAMSMIVVLHAAGEPGAHVSGVAPVLCQTEPKTVCELEYGVSSPSFTIRLTGVLNSALLVVIIIELAETVLQQVRSRERLYPALVRNFLVIGVVSAIRHLLTSGAQLSLLAATDTNRAELVHELLVNAIIVLILAGSLWLAERVNERQA